MLISACRMPPKYIEKIIKKYHYMKKLFQIHLKRGVKSGKFWLKSAEKRAKKWEK